MMTAAQQKKGFTLTEVVVALGIFAVAVPAILAMFSLFSDAAGSIVEEGESAATSQAFHLYLKGQVADPSSGVAPVDFDTVYGWAYAARQNPGVTQILYAYKPDADLGGYRVSQSPPPANTEGKSFAAQILAAEPELLPNSVFVPTAAAYTKAYLPIRLSVHALSIPTEAPTFDNFVEFQPLVISR